MRIIKFKISSIEIADMISDSSGAKKFKETVYKSEKEIEKWKENIQETKKKISILESKLKKDLNVYEKKKRIEGKL